MQAHHRVAKCRNVMPWFAAGEGVRSNSAWDPIPTIVDALDDAFYLAFDNVVPTNKRWLLALDVSSSMSWGSIAGSMLTPAEGAAAMAMVIARSEPRHHITAFSHTMVRLHVSASQRLPDILGVTKKMAFGGTDCALPMVYAKERGLDVDVFVVITDNETWAGRIHPPYQALQDYRRKTGIPAKLVVIGMASTKFSIADPTDGGMMDVVGFDASVPTLITDFAKA